jgi:nicotinate-nucleotide adenylyltransferase
MRLAFFGGSFDPPHMAHVLAVACALASGEVDGVLAVPCYQHFLGKLSTDYRHRLAMTRLAMNIYADAVEVSDIEGQLGGTSRTLDTLQALVRQRPEVSWRLLIGSDILAEADRWHRFDDVAMLAPPLVIGRAGFEGEHETSFSLPAIASSHIRRLIQNGQTPGHLVPGSVWTYIREATLYGFQS